MMLKNKKNLWYISGFIFGALFWLSLLFFISLIDLLRVSVLFIMLFSAGVYFLTVMSFKVENLRDSLPAIASLSISFIALLIAHLAFMESSQDSVILQEQLDELKKISALLESK